MFFFYFFFASLDVCFFLKPKWDSPDLEILISALGKGVYMKKQVLLPSNLESPVCVCVCVRVRVRARACVCALS